MKVYVTAVCEDLLDGSKQTVAEGSAELQDGRLTYSESQTKAVHDISFEPDRIVFIRKGETDSRITLPLEGTGKCKVTSAWGTMFMDAELVCSSRKEDLWTAEYRLFSGEEILTHRRMTWKIRRYS